MEHALNNHPGAGNAIGDDLVADGMTLEPAPQAIGD